MGGIVHVFSLTPALSRWERGRAHRALGKIHDGMRAQVSQPPENVTVESPLPAGED
jgi:hypothetical protein